MCISQSVKCSCPDWKKFQWPCKNILHIILTQSGLGWESLPQSYRSSPWFNLHTNFDEETGDDIDDIREIHAETDETGVQNVNEQVIPDENEDVNIGNKIDVEGE